jgi:hypothetical protein
VAFVLVVAACGSSRSSSDKDGGKRTDAMTGDALEASRDAPTEASDVANDGPRETSAVDVATEAEAASETFELPFQAVTIPSPLAVPPGVTLKVRYHGVGTQIYLCTTSGDADAGGDLVADGRADAGGAQSSDAHADALLDAGSDVASDEESDAAIRDADARTYAWVLVAPNALLFDETGTKFGTHSRGPTWTSTDGSAVTGIRRAEVPAPLNDAIPWLLLLASSRTGVGVFSDVTYIQQVNTTNGLAPIANCSAGDAGTMMSIGYTADYYFYSGTASVDAGGGVDAADNG